ncbi:MAG: M56 family metallopeptidase, partial [Clostridia bacterium]|nr:M56 family metallopeptidase [Clostridia bacterium]
EAPESTETAAPAPIAGTQDKPGGKRGLIKAAAYIWAAGAAAMLAYAGISWYALKRKLDTAVRLDGNVYESENVASPFLLGLIRPKIYLPFGLDETSRGYVTAHEKAHIKGLDHLWKPLGFLILSIHWPNPLAWVGYAVFCRDIELNCDERVAVKLDSDARAGYTQTLLDLSVSRRRITACPLAFGESNTKERVKNMLNYKKPAFWVIAAALLAGCLLAVCLLTNPKRAKEHRFITMTETMELADENGWVVIQDDYSYSIAKGEKEWWDFVNKANAGEPAEVVIAAKAEGPTTGKYKNLEDTLGDLHTVFKRVVFNGKKFTLSESSVYPLDFEKRFSCGSFDRIAYPGGDCWMYYLAGGELKKLSEKNRDEGFSSALYDGYAYPLLKLKLQLVNHYGEGWFDLDGDGQDERLCLGNTATGVGYKALTAYKEEVGGEYSCWLLCDGTPSLASKGGKPMLRVDDELIPIYFQEGRITLEKSDKIEFFVIRPFEKTVLSSEDAFSMAEANGWVAVNSLGRFVCGKETWKLFRDKVGAKEPAEVTIVRPDVSTLLLDPYQCGMEVDTVHVIRLVFDGNGFTVCKSVGNTDSFGEEREFTYLESEIGDTDDGRTYINYILTRKPLKELQSIDHVSETLIYENECFSLFCVNAADMYKLSELPREDIIAFLRANEIYVDPLYYDEKFVINEAIKAVEGIPEALWEINAMPYYAAYDLSYAANLYDGSIERPEKPLLSHMGEQGCLEKLREIGVNIPDELDFDLRDWVRQFEQDINIPSPFEGEYSWRSTLFESIRCMLFEYYDMSWLLLTDHRTDLEGYYEAAWGLMRGECSDWFRHHWSSEVTLAFTEGRFRAWDGDREYVEKFGGESRFEYYGLLAEYPAEVWDIASEKLSNYQYEYMHWGWEPGEPYFGPYPDGIISGGDSVLCEAEPWHDRQANVIMHRFADGEWREFGNSNIDYGFSPTGMCILNDKVGFVCYENRWEYEDCDGEHKPNWVNVWATYDGGNTWKNLDLTLPDEFLDTAAKPRAFSPVFQGEIGVIPVTQYAHDDVLRVAWFVTEDGGVTWSYGGCIHSDSERQELIFDKLIPPISAEFDLPCPLILRAEKGGETFVHIFVYPEEGGYIYDTEGRLVGCYKASPGEISDDPKVAFCFIAGGHWRVLIDEMYEPVENDYGCVAAITLAVGVNDVPGESFAEHETRICDAVIARNPETGAVFELVFDKDMLTREQLEAIARSIHVE